MWTNETRVENYVEIKIHLKVQQDVENILHHTNVCLIFPGVSREGLFLLNEIWINHVTPILTRTDS